MHFLQHQVLLDRSKLIDVGLNRTILTFWNHCRYKKFIIDLFRRPRVNRCVSRVKLISRFQYDVRHFSFLESRNRFCLLFPGNHFDSILLISSIQVFAQQTGTLTSYVFLCHFSCLLLKGIFYMQLFRWAWTSPKCEAILFVV